MSRVTLEIESSCSNISLMAVAINAIGAYAGLDRDKSNSVELALVEAVTNSIVHGYHGEPNHRVTVTIECDQRHIRFNLMDTGDPMQSDQVERLIRGRGINDAEYPDLSTIKEGGRGLEIIHRTMDQISYKREGRQNHLTLTSNLATD